jgi:NADH:ubiquinone oxidoreductase subunit E
MPSPDYAAILHNLDIPRRRDQLLPALHATHEIAGWLPEEAIIAVSRHCFVPVSELYGIVSSYSELRLSPPSHPHVELCAGLSCRLAGADALAQAAEPVAPVERVACRFLCGVAPVAEIAGRYHGRLAAARFAALIQAELAGDAV